MNMRDLIPWSRQSSSAPAAYRENEVSPVMSLRRDVDRLFDDFFRGSLSGFGLGRNVMAWPHVEVSETDSEVRVTADVPGLGEKDVEVLVDDGVLTLRGEKKSEREERDRGYSERFYGRFERRIALPSNVDEEHAQASFADGVLTITLPVSADKARGRRIPINASRRLN